MTLSSSRINDEFKLIQDILALCPGFGVPFKLYPQLELTLITSFGDARLFSINENGKQFALPIRHAAKYILRRYW